jgi:cholesterol transport system auxiliary component
MNRFFSLSMACMLAACGGGSAPEIYTLEAAPPSIAPCRTPAASITIDEPSAAPGLDTARIVVSDAPRHQTFYQGVRWSAPAPALVQHYLADRFERAGLFSGVSVDDSAMRHDWLLVTQLREFQVDQTGDSPAVRVRLTATLVPASGNAKSMTLPLAESVPVADASMKEIIAAYNTVLDRLSARLLETIRPTIAGCR